MNRDKKLLKALKKVFPKLKNKNNLSKLKLEQIKEWDSLKHFHLLLEIEKEFNFRFSTDSFNKVKSIKDIIYEIQKK